MKPGTRRQLIGLALGVLTLASGLASAQVRTTIERTECTLRRAVADLAAVERQLEESAARTVDANARAALDALGRELRPVVLALRGDPADAGHVNLPGRINWLTIQVGNYSGRPTAAQREWIATYAQQTADAVAALESVKQGAAAMASRR